MFHIDDDGEDQVAGVLRRYGEGSWAWTRFGEGDWIGHRAEPLTPQWFRFVVINILYPRGYQADFAPG